MKRLTTFFALLCLAVAPALPASAQNPFEPRLIINDRAITQFEVEQRALFLSLFNTPGDLEEEALNRLTEERLQLMAAERMGIQPTAEQVAEGMAEFAGRVEMDTEEFVQAIGEVGIYPESFRDFVHAGISWREVIRRRFGGRVDVTEAEIDRALSTIAFRGGVRLLLSEIILPDIPEFAEQTRELVPQIMQLTSFDAFSDAARRFSVSDTAANGGRLDWIELGNLPESLQPVLLQLRPGQVAEPIRTGEAVILFQLRAIDRVETLAPAQVSVEYARVLVPGAGSEQAATEIARLRANADTCRDLAGLVPSQPEERFSLQQVTVPELAPDVALELARLDAGEISANLRQGDAAVVLMLCARTPVAELRPGRAQMGDQIVNRRVNAMAQGYLEELRAQAHIRQP
ncbi:peptidylprolyl isomerase [Alkalilacustris brevis]|uniref:peptidylprolyl isomerase n=1 Tax=Alkalilacustris brevis TaxID=2026338 RepID=UPI000E0D61E1|nr:peptidylprolyl isomerase [Alkalilacustris brevis]